MLLGGLFGIGIMAMCAIIGFTGGAGVLLAANVTVAAANFLWSRSSEALLAHANASIPQIVDETLKSLREPIPCVTDARG